MEREKERSEEEVLVAGMVVEEMKGWFNMVKGILALRVSIWWWWWW